MRRAFRRSLVAAAVAAVFQQSIALAGGLDIVTSPQRLGPGYCRLAQNFEANIYGGYRRIAGYERFDGQAAPSDAEYGIISATITGAYAIGNTLTGATSGATGVILDATATYFVVTKVTGVFLSGENLQVAAVTVAVSSSTNITGGASTALLHAQYENLAADLYRADILAIPGSGATLGVWLYNDITYGFRNNAGGTAAEMYKKTAAGWSKITFEYYVSYTVGSGAATIIDGGTLTQGGVTATVRRVLVRSGSLAAGSALGTLVISAPAGGNFAAGAATVGAGTLTLGGVQAAITLAPSGRFEFVNANFGGSNNTTRMYGCDGVSKAFEFDGSYFVPIPTGMTTDTPSHIGFHKNQLFLAFMGSSQNSGPGTPYAWSPVTGASEIGMGDTITAYAVQPGSQDGGALAILSRNRTDILYGSSSADWNKVTYRTELGAYPYTVQDIGRTIFLDDRGITDLATAQTFGNFAHATLSNAVQPLVNSYRPSSVASCISRDLSQYRLFFTNGYGLYTTIVGKKVVGIMPVLFPDVVRCMCSGEMSDGTEAIFFGSDDGYVYQMEKGTSFDGDAIDAYIVLAWNFSGNSRQLKRYRRAITELSGDGYASIDFGYTLGYGSTDYSQPVDVTITTSLSETIWDLFTWDAFTWDGVTLIPSAIALEGTAENISVAYRTNVDYMQPITITGLTLQYTPRRGMR